MKFKVYKNNNLIEELLALKFRPYDTTYKQLYLREAKNNVVTKENNIINLLQSHRRIDMRGLDLYDPQDIAIIGKMCRDMRYETTRFLYVKDGVIVGADTTTTGLPTTSYAGLKFNTSDGYDYKTAASKTLFHIKEKIKKLDADSVYVLHNHPVNDVEFSDADKQTFEKLKKNIPEIKDAIVVGINDIAFLEADKVIRFDDLQVLKDNAYIGAEYLDDIADQVKSYLTSPDYSLLVYTTVDYNILNIDEIKNTEFKEAPISMSGYLKNQKKAFGAARLYIYTESLNVLQEASVLQSFGINIVSDVFYYHKDTSEMVSLQNDLSAFKAKDSDYNELGRITDFAGSVKG